jgi:DNA-binding MarR family transcriptional regulator
MPATRPGLAFDPIAEARRLWREHGWDDSADGMAAVTSVMRVEQILLGRVDQVLAPFHLTFARYEVLALLDFSSRGSLPLGKVGSRLQVHPTSVTNAVDRLEAQGFVRRVPHPSDGRATLAELTAEGRRTVHRATKALNAEVFSVLGLDADELTSLFGLLEKIRRAAGDFA